MANEPEFAMRICLPELPDNICSSLREEMSFFYVYRFLKPTMLDEATATTTATAQKIRFKENNFFAVGPVVFARATDMTELKE
jgi:hypothetical protein